jgi:subtilisin family serine protease
MHRLFRAVAGTAAALAVLSVNAPPASAADRVRDQQWQLGSVNADKAHQVTQGAGVTVAVIGTGVDATHPDLAGAVLPGADFADDGDTSPAGREDRDGLGTTSAALIAGRGHGQGAGVLGVAPRAMILPVRDTSAAGRAPRRTPEAIRWAVAHGAKVISLSASGRPDEPALRAAVADAQSANVVVVAPVADEATGATVGFPAAYPGVLAVGGLARTGRSGPAPAPGPGTVLTAPAFQILGATSRAVDDDGYAVSDSAVNGGAVVAGVAALVRSRYPELSASEVAYRITATTSRIPALRGCRDEVDGYGPVDAYQAVTADVSVPPAGARSSPACLASSRQPDARDGDSTFRTSEEVRWDEVGGWWSVVFLGTGLLVGGAVVAAFGRLRRRRATG